MESSMTPDILRSALEEFYPVEDRLRDNPDFQRREALRRVIELYERGAERPNRADVVVPPDLPATPPGSSPATARPLNPEIVLSRPAVASDRPPGRRRGGWTKGNSKSSRIRDAMVAYLREINRHASGGEICRAILAKGVEVGGKKPSATVTAQLTGSHLFHHTDQGYGLTEWLNGRTARPNGQE
jgi:hypothetical protein